MWGLRVQAALVGLGTPVPFGCTSRCLMFDLSQSPQEYHVYSKSAQSREGPFGCEQSGTRPRRVYLSEILGFGRGPGVFGQKKRRWKSSCAGWAVLFHFSGQMLQVGRSASRHCRGRLAGACAAPGTVKAPSCGHVGSFQAEALLWMHPFP